MKNQHAKHSGVKKKITLVFVDFTGPQNQGQELPIPRSIIEEKLYHFLLKSPPGDLYYSLCALSNTNDIT